MATTEAQVRAYLEPEEPSYTAAAAALGPDALPILERLVQDADPLLASKAAYLASLIPDERAGRVLEEAARSRHATVRVAAAAGLQKQGDVTDDVAADLLTDSDPGVRKVAAKATRTRMSSGLRNRLTERASSDRDPARRAAARSAIENAPANTSEPDRGGGGSADAPAAGSSAPGEGGGDIGGGSASPRYTIADVGEDSGGGGDLGGGSTRSGTSDGPDGGGSIDGGSGGRSDITEHGGGSF